MAQCYSFGITTSASILYNRQRYVTYIAHTQMLMLKAHIFRMRRKLKQTPSHARTHNITYILAIIMQFRQSSGNRKHGGNSNVTNNFDAKTNSNISYQHRVNVSVLYNMHLHIQTYIYIIEMFHGKSPDISSGMHINTGVPVWVVDNLKLCDCFRLEEHTHNNYYYGIRRACLYIIDSHLLMW